MAKILKTRENATVLSSDELRKELLGDTNNQSNNELVFKEMRKRTSEYLMKGHNVIIDATNINYKKRKHFLQEVTSKIQNVEKIAFFLATPIEKCIINNHFRERKVPVEVIKRMQKDFYFPQTYEGFDNIVICIGLNSFNNYYFYKKIKELDKVPHDNPNHLETIGQHLMSVGKYLMRHELYSDDLILAGFLHDIGKLDTKEFKDCKGNKSDIAHYYNHENVGAYNSIFYLLNLGFNLVDDKDIILEVIKLVQWHMLPYKITHQKTYDRYLKLLGKNTMDKIMILHEADEKGREYNKYEK